MQYRPIHRLLKIILFTLVGLTFLWYIYSLNEIRRPTFFDRLKQSPAIKPLAQKVDQKDTSDYEVIQTVKHIDNANVLKHERIVNRKQTQVEQDARTKNYPKYYEDDLHPDWVFQISRTYDENHLHRWTELNHTTPKSKLWSQGENGNGFVPKNEHEAATVKKLLDEYKYNLYASEKISLWRSLPDYRYPECRNLTYPDRLPNVSVVIVMHNEAWSTILRTIWSIIDRSPTELLHEIIVVDDVSTWNYLKRPLDDYVEILPARVRILRTNQREGLIRARLIGAKYATGNILVFLDAHTECTQGWLEPIAARIANDRSVVAVPLIDAISSDDMSFSPSYKTHTNGLRWHLTFNWMDVPKHELLRTKNDRTAPLRTPSHIGCAFAIDREFFFEIGSYDTGMDIWGSENVELAFRVWMCGGSLEILPCSRVGHLYRISTYSFDGDKGKIVTRNNNRLIEVWMDDYRNHIYAAYPKSKEVSPGDLTERKELRKRLKCKNFRWYLEHIFPESLWLKEYAVMGEIRAISNEKCVDAESSSINAQLKLWPCHGYGGNQFFAYAKSGQFVMVEEHCIGINSIKQVVLVHCSDSDRTQQWTYNEEEQWIVNRDTGLCMQINENAVIVGTCDPKDELFKWTIKSTIPAD